MKKCFLIVIILSLALAGCGGNNTTKPPERNGVIKLAYEKPIDFKNFEVHVSLTPNFTPTGWNGTTWSEPNNVSEWNGTDKTLHTISNQSPIFISNLIPGTTYYVKVVAIDTWNNRSAPGNEVSEVAGDSQRSSTLVVAASDASPASKAGADYICDGVSDQETINEAINAAVTQNPGTVVTIKGTEGNYNIDGGIIAKSNLTLDIPGTIKVKDNLNSDINIITNEDRINGNTNICIKNINIDGNKSTRYENGIDFFKVNHSSIDNLKITNTFYAGVFLNYCSNVDIDKITVNECAFGVRIENSDSIKVLNSFVCSNFQMNISFYKTNNSNAIGCFANGNTAGSGITLEDSNKCTIANNKCKNNKDDGILLMINCNDNTISGNDAEGNNQENSYASNIRLTNACSNNNIQGNTCRKGEGSINPKYGIRIEDSTCEKNLVTNNDCYQSGVTAGISNAGTNTSFGAGNRNNDGTWSATPN